MEFLLSQAEKENDCGAEYDMRRLIPEFIVCLQAILLVCVQIWHIGGFWTLGAQCKCEHSNIFITARSKSYAQVHT